MSFKSYIKTAPQLMRPYVPGEDMAHVSVPIGVVPKAGGMNQWYITAEFFLENYAPATPISDFAWALRKIQEGKKVARLKWDRGMFIWLMPASAVKSEWCREPGIETAGGIIVCLGSLRMFIGSTVLTGWLPNTTDLFSDDWVVVD